MLRLFTRQFASAAKRDNARSSQSAPPLVNAFLNSIANNTNSSDQVFPRTFFAGRPQLYDILSSMDTLLNKYADQIPDDENELQPQPDHRWLSKADMEKQLGGVPFRAAQSDLFMQLDPKSFGDEYLYFQRQLDRLASIKVRDPLVQDILQKFTKPPSHLKSVISHQLDEMGRAYAVGYRRRLQAHVYLVRAHEPTEGRVLIDGLPMNTVLKRWRTRYAVAEPFEITGTLGQYNVWATIEQSQADAGGESSIADAIANGIANALVIHDTRYEEPLAEAKLLEPNTKQRERKKPGQPGARAKFQWVKR